MSKSEQNIKRAEKFIADYEKLLTQPALSNSSRERGEKDVAALRKTLEMAIRYADLLE
ncbi:hypothetical protein [Marinilactibacillus psychrotolerans]|uniref:hypothetical protein n=1 Tax=Marinilactibacillus psychrotolerans TaxID=191770 RepID=UPI0038852735